MADRFNSSVNRLGLDLTILAPLIALVVLLVASSLASEYFLNSRNLTNVMRQVSYTGIIAIGVTFVIIGGVSIYPSGRWWRWWVCCCFMR